MVETARDLAMFVWRRFERTIERGSCRIIDRTDEPGEVARCRRLAPAFLDAAPRLALEIDDHDIILDDQHLPEMKISVMADLHCFHCGRKQFTQFLRQRFPV